MTMSSQSLSSQPMSSESEQAPTITRREAIRRVSLLLGGAALIGCGRVEDVEKAAETAASAPANTRLGKFSVQEIAIKLRPLDEIDMIGLRLDDQRKRCSGFKIRGLDHVRRADRFRLDGYEFLELACLTLGLFHRLLHFF